MRLLLAGAHVLKELEVVRVAVSSVRMCARLASGRLARSRNAIRYAAPCRAEQRP